MVVWEGYDGNDNEIYYNVGYEPGGAIEERKNIKNQNVKIFPNPFIEKTIINIQKLKRNKITIYDISGKTAEEPRSNIIGKNLKSGVYFVKFGDCKPIKITKIR